MPYKYLVYSLLYTTACNAPDFYTRQGIPVFFQEGRIAVSERQLSNSIDIALDALPSTERTLRDGHIELVNGTFECDGTTAAGCYSGSGVIVLSVFTDECPQIPAVIHEIGHVFKVADADDWSHGDRSIFVELDSYEYVNFQRILTEICRF
jgi:hypothetical protein